MMSHLIRIELLKLRTVRTTYGLLATVVVLTAIIATAEASQAGSGSVAPLSTASGLTTVTTLTGWAMLLAAVLGVMISAGEFRHATATLTYLASPHRGRVLAAKATAAACAGAIFGLVGSLVATGIGIAFAVGKGQPIALSTTAMIGHGAAPSSVRRCSLPSEPPWIAHPLPARRDHRCPHLGAYLRAGHRRPIHHPSSLPPLHHGHDPCRRPTRGRTGRVPTCRPPRQRSRQPSAFRRGRSLPSRHHDPPLRRSVQHHRAARHHVDNTAPDRRRDTALREAAIPPNRSV